MLGNEKAICVLPAQPFRDLVCAIHHLSGKLKTLSLLETSGTSLISSHVTCNSLPFFLIKGLSDDLGRVCLRGACHHVVVVVLFRIIQGRQQFAVAASELWFINAS